MKRIGLVLVMAAALGAGTTFTVPAQAVGLSAQLGAAANDFNDVEQAQYIYGGRNYCWYPAGWHGAGWYWCGYAARVGFGWGGPVGWRGWHWRGGGRWHGGGHWHHH
jgi:hypothetical protein